MYNISEEVINFIEKTVKTWRVELTVGRKNLDETKNQRANIPRKCTITITIHNCNDATQPHTLRKWIAGYKLSKSQEKINHLINMDDKQFVKNEKELETLTYAVRIYSQDIGMRFGIEKCAKLVMKSGKKHLTDGMELPNQDKIITLREKKKPTNIWASWRLTPSNKWRWEKEFRKSISGEPESCLRQNYIAETLSKE